MCMGNIVLMADDLQKSIVVQLRINSHNYRVIRAIRVRCTKPWWRSSPLPLVLLKEWPPTPCDWFSPQWAWPVPPLSNQSYSCSETWTWMSNMKVCQIDNASISLLDLKREWCLHWYTWPCLLHVWTILPAAALLEDLIGYEEIQQPILMGLVGMLKATEGGSPGTAPSATSVPNTLLGIIIFTSMYTMWHCDA